MDENELVAIVANLLERSDIVWPKYGSETTIDLARRVVSAVSREIDGDYRSDDEEWTNREGMPEFNGSFR